MDFLILLGILVAAGLLIYLLICIAKEFQHIAAMKGHPEKRWFWWTLFLGMIGMLMVVALPDNRIEAQKDAPADEELPEI